MFRAFAALVLLLEVQPADQLSIVVQVLDVARANYRAKEADPFFEPIPLPAKPGLAIRLKLPVGDGTSSDGIKSVGFYNYENGELRFVLSTKEFNGFRALIFRDRKSQVRSYTGVNGYGVRTLVKAWTSREDAILLRSAPDGLASPFSSYANAPRNEYWVRLPLKPSEARQIASDVDLLLEGTLAGLAETPFAPCSTRSTDPTRDVPIDVITETCAIGIDARRIAFVRRSTGAVIAEWAK